MKTHYTTIDPIPSNIPRQLAIEILQSHGEVITVNPLVLEYHPIKPPRDAPGDEYYSSWYEIQERVQYLPGLGKIGSGKLSFRGCFHDMPWGVQTHMYVPLGIDLRHKYQIRGNQPGEPPEPKELGSDAPSEGLYLRVDCQIKANVTMVGFVKKEMKAASKAMVERMIKKAELIDAGALTAMFNEKGKLTTENPNDRTTKVFEPTSPTISSPRTQSVYGPNGINLRNSPSVASTQESAYGRQSGYFPSQQQQQQPLQQRQQQRQNTSGLAIMEMEGDTRYSQNSAHLGPNDHRGSAYSELTGSNSPLPPNARWSGAQSDAQSSAGSDYSRPTHQSFSEPARSPMYQGKSFAAELPNNEIPMSARPPRPEIQQQPQQSQQAQSYSYNPQDYANLPQR